MHLRPLLRVLPLATALLLVARQASACSWAKGYFHQVTRLRGYVVGAKLGPLQYARWLRQSFRRDRAKLTLYEYRSPITTREEMRVVKATETDTRGAFDLGDLKEGHYTLIVDDTVWGTSDWFDVEIRNLPKPTEIVTIDISPHFPDCKGGHEFVVNGK